MFMVERVIARPEENYVKVSIKSFAAAFKFLGSGLCRKGGIF